MLLYESQKVNFNVSQNLSHQYEMYFDVGGHYFWQLM